MNHGLVLIADWQNVAAPLVVAVAALFVGRNLWRSFGSKKSGSCGSCGSCSAAKETSAGTVGSQGDFVTLESLTRPRQ